MERPKVTIDGNEAAAHVAYLTNEVIAIYPITPASPMGELADAWATAKRPNLWGDVPQVIEMQSEGGAAGAVHGSLQAGALTTTFTASQGLLLMIPNMFKIAGELTPTVFHIAARSVATHALSIFGDHSDVMSARTTGWALLASSSVQEAQDMAMVAHMATLASRVPFLHFFDGFRTSHEINKIEQLTRDDVRTLIDDELVEAHRRRALSPDRPVLRGTAQNPDVFFQAREACNPYYLAVPDLVQGAMDRFAELTGRAYRLFDYTGAPDAERVLVAMGSGVGAATEAVQRLVDDGERVGLVTVRLYRPFLDRALIAALPATTKVVGVLDRTKEPGATGEPLYQDVLTSLVQSWAEGHDTPLPKVVGGRYGLSSKEFTPAMAKAVLDELSEGRPRNHFTVGIVDDVTHTSLEWDPEFATESADVIRAVFYGLGSDGTVGANKNSVKIIGENTPMFAQGYFVYDSKKSGARTVSHLRFSPQPLNSSYLIDRADFVACHQFNFLERIDVLEHADDGATLLLNSPHGPDDVWAELPVEVQQQVIDKGLALHVIDAAQVAEKAGLGRRINTVMQTCFFQLSGVLPAEEAIAEIKRAIEKTYSKRGEAMVRRNFLAVDGALDGLHQVRIPDSASGEKHFTGFEVRSRNGEVPDFVERVTSVIIAGKGDLLPVSAMPVDGTFPTATSQWEKRSIAREIPIWDPEICIQCNLCAVVCPHAAIRTKAFAAAALAGAPDDFVALDWTGKDLPEGTLLTVQVAPDDCTGCGVCVEICPARSKEVAKHKAINMEPKGEHLERERKNFDFFLDIAELDRTSVDRSDVKSVAAPAASLRVLGRLRRLRRDAISQAADSAVRRPNGGRQRHRLLIDLRRQPADDAVGNRRDGARSDLVELALRGQCRVRSGDAPSHRPATLARSRSAAEVGRRPGAGPRERAHRGIAGRRGSGRCPARSGGAAPGKAREDRHLRGATASRRRGLSRRAQRLDRGWRRLGLRYRLRRARPRAGLRPERQRHRARHRGLLEHGWPGFEGDAPRGGRQVCLGRKADRQEGPRYDRDGLRQRVRGPGGDRGAAETDRPGVARGGGVRRTFAHHRVLELHRPRHRDVERHGDSEDGRAERVLAALPLLARPRRRRRYHPVPSR